MNESLLTPLNEQLNPLESLLKTVPDGKFNSVPYENSWTPAQLAEHLLKSFQAIGKVLFAPGVPSGRKGDEKVGPIKNTLLDFGKKLESPEFIQPGNQEQDPAKMLSELERAAALLNLAVSTLDPNETCTTLALPNLGELTRLEWTWFIIYHTQRHIEQLKRMIGALTEE